MCGAGSFSGLDPSALMLLDRLLFFVFSGAEWRQALYLISPFPVNRSLYGRVIRCMSVN